MARVLLVDDAAFMRMRCGKLLVENGHEVVEAENGAEGVRQYLSSRPDVVLMDITMPVMDGISALKEIMRQDSGARVVMCSAAGQKSMVIEAIKSGAKDFVMKPYEPERILSTIAKVVT